MFFGSMNVMNAEYTTRFRDFTLFEFMNEVGKSDRLMDVMIDGPIQTFWLSSLLFPHQNNLHFLQEVQNQFIVIGWGNQVL